jgi:DNA-binding CsgD family transcriptional regulator
VDRCARPDLVGGPAASLYFRDGDSRSVAYQFGLDPRYVQLYVERYSKLDPTRAGYFFAKLEHPTSAADVMPYDEFLQSRFYKEWAYPQGLVDSVHAVLERSAMTAACVVVFRHERDGVTDDEARQRMLLLIPHIRRAALIGKIIDLKKAEAASLADSLDGISAGVFLVDATGCIIHANSAAHVILEGANVLHVERGRLIAKDHRADQALGDTFAVAGTGDAAVGIKGIGVPIPARNGEHYVAHVLPLTSGARRQAGESYRASAAVFVHKAALNAPSPSDAIAKAYGLTPAELRVLLAVFEVGGVPEVADALGISQTTIKTHLGQLYEKTGAHRQADLVKLVAAFSNPLLE